MRLSTKAQYAVRAMVSLHLYSDDGPVPIKDISAREEISAPYLEQLFVKLRRGGMVQSVRGPGGGYRLARAAGDIRVDEIIDSVEETLVPVSCMDRDGKCRCDDNCLTHSVWQGLSERIRQFLASMTLEDLTRDADVNRKQ
ncbi:MAG: transcriptional regulator [Desulfuromonas sp.]|nr:MAG: transcriptional regulator [Desulfuromonas sp.]